MILLGATLNSLNSNKNNEKALTGKKVLHMNYDSILKLHTGPQ